MTIGPGMLASTSHPAGAGITSEHSAYSTAGKWKAKTVNILLSSLKVPEWRKNPGSTKRSPDDGHCRLSSVYRVVFAMLWSCQQCCCLLPLGTMCLRCVQSMAKHTVNESQHAWRLLHGEHVAQAWQQHGKHMANTWQMCHVCAMCSPCIRHAI